MNCSICCGFFPAAWCWSSTNPYVCRKCSERRSPDATDDSGDDGDPGYYFAPDGGSDGGGD